MDAVKLWLTVDSYSREGNYSQPVCQWLVTSRQDWPIFIYIAMSYIAVLVCIIKEISNTVWLKVLTSFLPLLQSDLTHQSTFTEKNISVDKKNGNFKLTKGLLVTWYWAHIVFHNSIHVFVTPGTNISIPFTLIILKANTSIVHIILYKSNMSIVHIKVF